MPIVALAGQIAVVTGAGAGIGENIACMLAAAGACVVAGDRDLVMAGATARRIVAAGGRAIAVECEITKAAHRARLVADALACCGEITVLVNTTSGPEPRTFDGALDDLVRAFERNVVATYLLCELCAPEIEVAGGGAILNVSAPEAGAMAVAALQRLTRELASQLGPRGIRVNAIVPGAMGRHEGSDGAAATAACYARAARCRIPLRRAGEVADVGYAALFLCSYAADWISGEVLSVDGGARLNG